nr:MAG TPA: hypothetical protein [Caudoviricetes sp.]
MNKKSRIMIKFPPFFAVLSDLTTLHSVDC